jgi:hypothetical protein
MDGLSPAGCFSGAVVGSRSFALGEVCWEEEEGGCGGELASSLSAIASRAASSRARPAAIDLGRTFCGSNPLWLSSLDGQFCRRAERWLRWGNRREEEEQTEASWTARAEQVKMTTVGRRPGGQRASADAVQQPAAASGIPDRPESTVDAALHPHATPSTLADPDSWTRSLGIGVGVAPEQQRSSICEGGGAAGAQRLLQKS